jgi:uncharacterized repeat protein (TIGR01451 family)
MTSSRITRIGLGVSALLSALWLSGCGDLAFVQPTDNQTVRAPVTRNAATVEVPIEIDFSANTRARNVVLDGTLNITTAPAAGFTTNPGAGQKGWDRMRGQYPMTPGQHSLTASAEYLDYARNTQTISRTVQFTVVPPNLPDLWASITSNVATFNGSSPVTFDVTIHNRGTAPASNVFFTFHTNMPAGMSTLRIDSGFACRGLSGFGQALQAECSGGQIAASQTAHMTVTVRPTNPVPRGTPFTLYGYLDLPGNAILESDETNNSFTKAVLVGP